MTKRTCQNQSLEKAFVHKLRRDEPLCRHTTFKIGGPARYFLEIESIDELIRAIGMARSEGLDYAVIGGGSNILVSDRGFDGLVVEMAISHCRCSGSNMAVGAGLSLKDLSEAAGKNGLVGLEWAAGVPGTLGGAIWGNAGCFGHEIKHSVVRVRYFDAEEVRELNNAECRFGYRESMFKKRPHWIILEAELKLAKGDRKEIERKTRECLDLRDEKLPLEYPSAGSMFKKYEIKPNETLPSRLVEDLKEDHPDFLQEGYIPAGWLIERVGLKGKTAGDAQISEKHSNFVINLGGATADQVMTLITVVKKEVRRKLGMQLREEVVYLGFDSRSRS